MAERPDIRIWSFTVSLGASSLLPRKFFVEATCAGPGKFSFRAHSAEHLNLPCSDATEKKRARGQPCDVYKLLQRCKDLITPYSAVSFRLVPFADTLDSLSINVKAIEDSASRYVPLPHQYDEWFEVSGSYWTVLLDLEQKLRKLTSSSLGGKIYISVRLVFWARDEMDWEKARLEKRFEALQEAFER